MEDIKKLIESAAKEIISGVGGVSEGTVEYEKLMEQLIYIQTINYNSINSEEAIELPEQPEPLAVGPAIYEVAAQIDKRAKEQEAQKEKEEKEALEEEREALEKEKEQALRH